MNAPDVLASTPWLALPLLLAVVVACCTALLSRSLFVVCLCLLVAGATGASVLLLLSQGSAAPEFALSAAAWGPLSLAGAVVLSKRAAKARARAPWLSFVLGSCVAAVLVWAVLADAPASGAGPELGHRASALWLAPLFLVMGIAAMAIAGYGERGVFGRSREPG